MADPSPDDAPATVVIRRDGRIIPVTHAQRKSLIEQVHAVRRANAARHPMPDEDLIAIFRPGPIPPEDYVPRVLDPPPPEEDEEPFACDLPAPAPTPRRRPGRPPKHAPRPGSVAPAKPERCGPPCVVLESFPVAGEPLPVSSGPEPAPADPEIAVFEAVKALDPPARARVLAYLRSRFPSE